MLGIKAFLQRFHQDSSVHPRSPHHTTLLWPELGSLKLLPHSLHCQFLQILSSSTVLHAASNSSLSTTWLSGKTGIFTPRAESSCLCLFLCVFSWFPCCSPAAFQCLHICSNDRWKSNWYHASVCTLSGLWKLQLSFREGTFRVSYS